jgi:hypothetical protein
MIPDVYRYSFAAHVPFVEVESSLVLAIMAAENLRGQAQVRLDAAHTIDAEKRVCVVDGSTPVGRDINRLFVGFLHREFGPDSFSVERAEKTEASRQQTV